LLLCLFPIAKQEFIHHYISMKKGVDYIGVGVGAIILNDKKEVFLAKRGKKAKNERGTWEFPGGGVEFGERLADAIKREMMEEYGIEIEVVYQLNTHDHIIPEDGQHWVAPSYIAKIVKGEPKIMEVEKCEEIGWFNIDNLPQPLSLITQASLPELQEYLQDKAS
jgi:mutator protein MutT